jgi:transposase
LDRLKLENSNFDLPPDRGPSHDLEGADVLPPAIAVDALLADKAFDADKRVIEPLLARGKSVVIPPKSNRKVQREFDKEAYKAGHLIENFFSSARSSSIAPSTRYDKTARNFLPLSISRLLLSGSIEDRP